MVSFFTVLCFQKKIQSGSTCVGNETMVIRVKITYCGN